MEPISCTDRHNVYFWTKHPHKGNEQIFRRGLDMGTLRATCTEHSLGCDVSSIALSTTSCGCVSERFRLGCDLISTRELIYRKSAALKSLWHKLNHGMTQTSSFPPPPLPTPHPQPPFVSVGCGDGFWIFLMSVSDTKKKKCFYSSPYPIGNAYFFFFFSFCVYLGSCVCLFFPLLFVCLFYREN